MYVRGAKRRYITQYVADRECGNLARHRVCPAIVRYHPNFAILAGAGGDMPDAFFHSRECVAVIDSHVQLNPGDFKHADGAVRFLHVLHRRQLVLGSGLCRISQRVGVGNIVG